MTERQESCESTKTSSLKLHRLASEEDFLTFLVGGWFWRVFGDDMVLLNSMLFFLQVF